MHTPNTFAVTSGWNDDAYLFLACDLRQHGKVTSFGLRYLCLNANSIDMFIDRAQR
jgi:hypothetical protein